MERDYRVHRTLPAKVKENSVDVEGASNAEQTLWRFFLWYRDLESFHG